MHLYGLGKLNSLSHEIADCPCAENKHKSKVNDDVSFEQKTTKYKIQKLE